MDRMSPLDALFLDVEDDISHMHIGSCAVFEGPPPPFDDLVALIDSKLPLLTRYRQVVRTLPGGIGRPVWVDDVHFNLAYHVRHTALPAPGDEAVLNRLMGRLMSQPLDRRRPLWETWVVEGLTGGSWAIVSKVHHCMVDGISGTDLMASLLDQSADTHVPAIEQWTPAPPPSDLRLIGDAVRELVATPAAAMRLALDAARAPRRAMARAADIVDGLRDYGDRLATPAPLLSIEGPIGPHRRWAAARCSLDDVKAIRRDLGGSVNDVVLAVVTGAFRHLLVERGDDVDRLVEGHPVVLRSLVPVSSRPPDDHSPNNQVTAIIAELPVGIADPVARLHAVSEQMARLKQSHQPLAGEAVQTAAELAPPALLSASLRALASMARAMPQRRINTVTTNVPGPRRPLYALGRLMLEYLPFVPLSQGVRIGVAILSYDGHVAFGVTGDYDAVPDTETMATHIEDGIAELLGLAAAHAATAHATAPRPRSTRRAS
jgi:diacylglycerol O-acyltransferase / wax synthase